MNSDFIKFVEALGANPELSNGPAFDAYINVGQKTTTLITLRGLNLIQSALKLATRAHIGQTRNDGSTPYITHPLAVAMIVSEAYSKYMGSRGSHDQRVRLIAAGILHDVLEDCDVHPIELLDALEGHQEVYGTINALTNPPKRGATNRADRVRYLAWKAANCYSEDAAMVKIADRWHNLACLAAENDPFFVQYAKETLLVFENYLYFQGPGREGGGVRMARDLIAWIYGKLGERNA